MQGLFATLEERGLVWSGTDFSTVGAGTGIDAFDTNGVRWVKTGEASDEGRDDGRSNMLLQR